MEKDPVIGVLLFLTRRLHISYYIYMKNISDIINEGILDMDDDEVFDKKTEVRELGLLLSAIENAPKGVDRDALGNKLEVGDFVLFYPMKGVSGRGSLLLGEVIKIMRNVVVQVQKGRVNFPSNNCVKVTKDMVLNRY